jgi:ribose transport system permease protein
MTASNLAVTRVPGRLLESATRNLAFTKVGALYVLAVIVVVFTVWVPDLFLTVDTARQVLNSSAIAGMIALSLVVPLATKTFDLSIGTTVTLSGVATAHFLSVGWSVPLAVGLGLGIGLLVGVFNGIVVVVLKVDSFIATLATGALGNAFAIMATNDQQIVDPALYGPFAKIAQTTVHNVTLPVIYMVVLAVMIWVFLQYTPSGRRMYATGFNAEAARLARIRVNRLRFISLLVSGVVAGAAGVVLTSQTGAGTPGSGDPYLLSAYAAVFLGATQFHAGRFNAWGTVVAVLLLGTGTTGLGLAGAPPWAPSMFTGAVLIIALVVTGAERRSARAESKFSSLARLWGRLRRHGST